MSFLYGRTTWGALRDKFLGLISGASLDDQAVACDVGDRWRVSSSGVSGDYSMAPPATEDETITQEHRMGYWSRFDDCVLYYDGTVSGKDFMQQKSCWSAWDTNFKEWVIVTTRVSVTNTTASNYSTARVILYAFSLGSDGSHFAMSSGTTLTPASDGTCTYTYGSSTMTFKIGNAATGKVMQDSFYARCFANTFRGGVDWWRRSGRNVDGLHSFTETPTGTEGTDWTVNIGPQQLASPGVNNSNYSVIYNYMAGLSNVSGASVSQLGSCGLAIKTNAGLTGDHYKVSFTKQEALCYLSSSATSLYLLPGGFGVAFDGTPVWGVEGNSYASAAYSWLNGSPASGDSIVQYWITVSATSISVVLNVQQTSGWQITSNTYTKVVRDDESYGVCWMRGYLGYNMYWLRNGMSALLERAMYKGAGFNDGGRDWQTGQGRLDITPLLYYNFWYRDACGGQNFYFFDSELLYLQSRGSYSNNAILALPQINDKDFLPLSDTRWRMSGFSLMDDSAATAYDTVKGRIGKNLFRGYVAEGLYQAQSGDYNAGDELTDTVTGDKYLLWIGSTAFMFPGPLPDSSYPPGVALEEK